MDVTRRQIPGAEAVGRALDAGSPLRLVLACAEQLDPVSAAVVERARAAGIAIRLESANVLRRLSSVSPPAAVLGLVGPEPAEDLGALLRRGGASWLLVGLEFPGNTGFAIRQAEVSGADGVVVDGRALGSGRRRALRSAMGADRYFPVLWATADEAIDAAQEAGCRIVAVEDSGTAAPWELDLRRGLLLVVGGEREGIPPEVLARCDEVVRLPMAGFIPCYNVQAAMAAVASERLRQLDASGASS